MHAISLQTNLLGLSMYDVLIHNYHNFFLFQFVNNSSNAPQDGVDRLPTFVEGRVVPFNISLTCPSRNEFPWGLVYFKKEECSRGLGISMFALLEVYLEHILWT